MVDRSGNPRSRRAQWVYRIVAKWGPHVQEAYRTDPRRWAESMGQVFAKASPDALNFMSTWRSPRENRAVRRFDGNHVNLLLLFQESADSCDGATSADTTDDDIDFASGVFPDLRAGRVKVNLRIRWIVELSWHEPIRPRRKLFCMTDSAFHAINGWSQNQSGSECSKECATFA